MTEQPAPKPKRHWWTPAGAEPLSPEEAKKQPWWEDFGYAGLDRDGSDHVS